MKRRDKELRILKSAIKVIIEHGINNFSINNVIKETNISKGGFIYYYPSKDDLLNGLNQYILKFSTESIKNQLAHSNTFTEAYIKSSLAFYQSDEMKAWTLLSKYNSGNAWGENYEVFYSYVLENLQKENKPEWVSLILLCTDGIFLNNSVSYWSVNELERALEFLLHNIKEG